VEIQFVPLPTVEVCILKIHTLNSITLEQICHKHFCAYITILVSLVGKKMNHDKILFYNFRKLFSFFEPRLIILLDQELGYKWKRQSNHIF
jgi:hypothetical protein